MRVKCDWCGKMHEKHSGHVNRSRSINAPLYCNMKCAGLARRVASPKSPRNPNWKAMKAEYDRQYREKNLKRIKAKKREYFKRTYDPVKAAAKRKKTMARHIEYCRQPEYKKYKAKYDRKRRSEAFGEFAGAHKALIVLQKEIRKQEPNKEERYRQAQRHGWSPLLHQRKREKRANERIINLESVSL